MYKEYSNHDVAVYGGYLIDDSEILKSSSGGIASALAHHFIKNGGYVAGVVYSKDFYGAEYLLTNCIEDIDKFKGSKYIDVDKKTIYNDVKKLLIKGEKVLFFGFPCVIAAIKGFCREVSEQLVLCEVICTGPTRPEVQKQYIEFLEKKHKSKCCNFSTRHKEKEWLPKFIKAEFENGAVFVKEFSRTQYRDAFAKMGMERCYKCPFKGNNRKGDIMLGDFWGANPKDVFWNKKGVSVIFAETPKGNAIIKSVESIKLFDTSFEKAVSKNPKVIDSRKRDNNSDRFVNYFNEKGLIFASKKTRTIKEKMINFLKAIVPRRIIMILIETITPHKKE